MSETLLSQILIALSAVAASGLGYFLAGVNEARRDRRTLDREERSRAADLRLRALQDRHAFQLEVLLQLQDAIQLMARLNGRSMLSDHMQAREGRYTQLPDGLSDELHANSTDVIRLRNRLLDEELRTAIKLFEQHCTTLILLPKEYEGLEGDALESAAMQRSADFGAAYDGVMNKLGESLRSELAWIPNSADAALHT